MTRLHSHRGRETPHAVNDLAGHDAMAVMAAHGTEIGRWGRRKGRPGKRERDRCFLERRMGQEVRR